MNHIKLVFLSCLISLTSCSILSPIKPPGESVYEINKLPAPEKKYDARPISLLVIPPETKVTYDTTQMAYTSKPYQISYFSLNKWAERPAQMLFPLMVQSLQNTHHFHAVISAPYTGHTDYLLTTQILSLKQNVMYSPAKLELVVRAQLIKVASNRVVAVKQFNISYPIVPQTPYAGVIAANRATARLLDALDRFCVNNT
jgi:cholesterol transport system auxiliary component